jgi:hypothetical protein
MTSILPLRPLADAQAAVDKFRRRYNSSGSSWDMLDSRSLSQLSLAQLLTTSE